jgi:hypothetical protein
METHKPTHLDNALLDDALIEVSPHAQEDSFPLLSESDSTARAFGYKANASTVDKTKFPQYSPGETCSNCSIYLGIAGRPSGPCPIFRGKAVAAAGWCASYASRN